jgi:hypothetical protein
VTIEVRRDPAQGGIDEIHAKRVDGVPGQSPSSAPGRCRRHAATAPSISASLACGLRRRKTLPLHAFADLIHIEGDA